MLSLPRNSDSWSPSMMNMLELVFIVGGGGGDDVITWVDTPVGTPGRVVGDLFVKIFHWLFLPQNLMASLIYQLQCLYLHLN